jgi:cell division protease FtsH
MPQVRRIVRSADVRGCSAPRRSPEVATSPPTTGTPRRRRFGLPGWVLVVVAVGLLGLNFWAASRAVHPVHRVRVPYSPFVLDQVRAGNVQEITSTGTAVQGAFRRPLRYPRGHGSATRQFATEIPAFADVNALSRVLESNHVVMNAKPLDTGPPWWQSLLLGFGPTLLFLGLLLVLFRRVAAGAGA